MFLLGFIFIIYKYSEHTNNKNKDLKAKIYYIALKTILQLSYPNLLSTNLKKLRFL